MHEIVNSSKDLQCWYDHMCSWYNDDRDLLLLVVFRSWWC